ncbi:Sec34-like family protein [Durotheca rogersii]|uniref:Sec34-like family protein n=1 Tax=Durotheca rogersii TaxID=419775 RepID=UPI00221FF8D9|nr:Sec34-like family protein [Durotheca rogersii]KAI5863691.1 Sec34-like family protein [Durotheca rogersii]
MYEDSWYNFVPDHTHKRNPSTQQTSGHRRRGSLLQQPNGANQPDAVEPLDRLFEEPETSIDPPEPTLTRRAKSYSDFYRVVRAQLSKDAVAKKRRRKAKERSLDALMIGGPEIDDASQALPRLASLDGELIEASQREYLLYRDQLGLAERHLDTLIGDANGALDLLTSLADSFRAVESHTSSFQAQCDDLLTEERRLRKLADEVGTDWYYYDYLDGVTRRLNAPGASRLASHESFGEILTNLDACIAFMVKHPDYRDAESYLARYQSLLTKALHLLEVSFTGHLDRISADISKQIVATQSDSARHALAYGRFEELVLEADGLVFNVQRVVRSCYEQLGNPIPGQNFDYYSNTAVSLFSSYSSIRDRDLRPMTQQDLAAFKKDVKDVNTETACRNFIKRCYERSFNEASLFAKVFSIEPQYNADVQSVYAILRRQQRALVDAANIAPISTTLQPVLQPSDLQTVCNLLGWITNEYLILEDDEEEETQYSIHCHDLTARLLIEHLWPLTDNSFDSEVTKSISRASISPDALKISPVVNGIASSNAYPITKRALELLAMYDQAMPKERSSSPVVFRIIDETILALQRAESRLKASKAATPDPDPDLFMIKNLLILKNGLVSLEIGDVRPHPAAMQHFSQIWDTLSPQNWLGLFRGILGGTLTLSLWSSAANSTVLPGRSQAPAEQDAHEKLDDLLRQSIYAFTQRWGTLMNAARGGKRGAQSSAALEKELDEKLLTAFGGQPEVVAKLKEAIQINAQAQKEVKAEKSVK